MVAVIVEQFKYISDQHICTQNDFVYNIIILNTDVIRIKIKRVLYDHKMVH